MSLIKCKKCGEMFSDSYKTCPFCEEDDAYYGGRATKRRRRAETPRRKAPSILGPVVVLVLILLVLLVVWLLFGDQIKTAIGGQKPPVEDVIPEPTPTPDPDPVEPADTITLNRAVLALDVGGKETLKVNEETTETCAWSSSDPAVVTVSDTGEVTAAPLSPPRWAAPRPRAASPSRPPRAATPPAAPPAALPEAPPEAPPAILPPRWISAS